MGLGRLSATVVSHDAGMRSCPPSRLGHDHPVVRLLVVVSGQMELTVGLRHITVGMGSGVFVEGDSPFSYVTHGPLSYIAADFCADGRELSNLLPEPGMPLGIPSLVAAVSGLVAHAFSPHDAPRAVQAPSPDQRAKVLAHIAAHHTDTRMSVATLAADFGLSMRTLQRLFAGQEKGVAEEIAAARLHHALMLLRDPQWAGASLEEIARRSGFGAVARMRRTVQAATGKSLREYRARGAGARARDLRVAV
jgi:AraC-like DNA-binding protein